MSETREMLEKKLAMAKCISKDFRENTSLCTIVREYELRLKEFEKYETKK